MNFASVKSLLKHPALAAFITAAHYTLLIVVALCLGYILGLGFLPLQRSLGLPALSLVDGARGSLPIWLLAGLLLAGINWWFMYYKPLALRIATSACLCLAFIAAPYSDQAIADYLRQQQLWLSAKCQAVLTGPVTRFIKSPVPAEGFLDRSNYDDLLNVRFQRNAPFIEVDHGGGARSYDTSNYRAHPIFTTFGGSFEDQARKILTGGRFSYVEFEMTPEKDGQYSNGGSLDTKSWSGKRYRLYTLAPAGSPGCQAPAAVPGPTTAPPTATDGSASANVNPGEAIAPPDASALCIRLEITDQSISKHVFSADEAFEFVPWTANLFGIEVPAWTRVRWDRVRMLSKETGELLGQYLGFDYPNEVSRRYACNAAGTSGDVIPATLIADEKRAFLKSRPGYEGSAVQRFYESGEKKLP